MDEKKLTGYPSVDKPWLKYYKDEHKQTQLPNMTAIEYLKELNKEHLDYIAINSVEGTYSYRDLFTKIEQTASALFAHSIQKGSTVLAMLPPISYEVFLLYAVDIVGAAICYLAPGTPVEEICESINLLEAKAFFTLDTFLSVDLIRVILKRTNVQNIVVIHTNLANYIDGVIPWDSFIEKGANLEPCPVDRQSNDLLFIAKTGGTTGVPKNVMLTDDCFNIAVHQYFNSDLNYQAGDRWLRLWPIFSATAAISSCHLSLCAGMENILRAFPLDLANFDRIILDERPNHLLLIPQLLDVLDKSPLIEKSDLSFIKSIGVGGASISSQVENAANNFLHKHNIPIFLGYGWGCTENSTSAAMRMNRQTTVVGTVGIPLVNTIVSVFDPDDGTELTYGEEGELCIHSHTMMLGYYNDVDSTQKVLKLHSDGLIWLHTGDIGTVDKDGFVRVAGRMTRSIFVFYGPKVYPIALENVISRVAGVREVAVCETPDLEHDGFYLPVCFIVADIEYDLEDIKNDVNKLCAEELPEYSRPRKILFEESFPLTKVGKVDYRKLEEIANQ